MLRQGRYEVISSLVHLIDCRLCSVISTLKSSKSSVYCFWNQPILLTNFSITASCCECKGEYKGGITYPLCAGVQVGSATINSRTTDFHTRIAELGVAFQHCESFF